MKIYINSEHQIKAVKHNDTGDYTLTEIEVEDDFLAGYCDTLLKAFCYHKWKDENGNEMLSVYPYKDFSVMESIQQEHEVQERQTAGLLESAIDNDYRLSMIELGL